MKVLLWLGLSFVFLTSLSAQENTRTETLKVKSLEFNSSKGLYRLHLAGRAGAYYAQANLLDCLKRSISDDIKVELEFDAKTLLVANCKVRP